MSYAFKVIHTSRKRSTGTLNAVSELAAFWLLFETYPQCVAIFVMGE